jgi:hypothetical protein
MRITRSFSARVTFVCALAVLVSTLGYVTIGSRTPDTARLTSAMPAGGAGSTRTAAEPPPDRSGRFIVNCQPTVRGKVDPIVFPGEASLSHSHDIYGPTEVDASDRVRDLIAAPTSCGVDADRSGYWAPTVYQDGKPVMPQRMQAYYGVDQKTKPYPRGLRMVVGSAKGTETDGVNVAWLCAGAGSDQKFTSAPASCEPGEYLMVVFNFPGCWDGVHKDSSDHISHLAFETEAGCPGSHPVHIPQLAMNVQFSWTSSDYSTVEAASGVSGSIHADFVSGWRKGVIRDLISRCVSQDCNHQGTDKPAPDEMTPVTGAESAGAAGGQGHGGHNGHTAGR